ncbi:hypothetical protein V6N13_049345 [Hibiscus sabdariffa]|uniref:Uncharacterized protein n=1 Tax=Hibiscus sabdariffa TaxID=183260 RepID=A0ABR2QY34_9ROSI
MAILRWLNSQQPRSWLRPTFVKKSMDHDSDLGSQRLWWKVTNLCLDDLTSVFYDPDSLVPFLMVVCIPSNPHVGGFCLDEVATSLVVVLSSRFFT